MTELIDKKSVEKSHRSKLRDFYRNPKDCPANPNVLKQKRDFYRETPGGKQIPAERTTTAPAKETPVVRAAMAPRDANKEAKSFGHIFFQQYKQSPPKRRTEIVKDLSDSTVLEKLLNYELAPTIKGLIARRLKELGNEPIGDPSEGPA